jgi:flagellum-specific peptidoglycan hydrolase FlgJ
MTKTEFISKYGNFAKAASVNSGLSPVLILAQAYLESGRGESLLSKKYNNFFGIKADKSWNGKRVLITTREQDKQGKDFFIKAEFRVYPSPADSFSDHIKFLKVNPRYRKAGLFSFPNDFNKQADTLQAAGYATDINYSKVLKAVGNNFESIFKKLSENNTILLIPVLLGIGIYFLTK